MVLLEGPSCNETKYSAEWQWTDGNLVFSPNTYPVIAKPTSMWSRVIVTFSEEMQNAELTIQGLDIYNRLPLPETFGENQKGWQLNIDDFNGVSSGEFTMEFVNCTDLANTSLYGFNNTSSLPGASITKRQANGVWSPSYSNHIDDIHSFSIVFSGTDINFEAINPGMPIGGSTYFHNTSTNIDPGTNWWKWEFEGGDPPVVYQECIGAWSTGPISYNNPGEFDVTLKQMDPSYEVVYTSLTKEKYIVVGNIPEADFEASPLEANMGVPIIFSDLSTNNPISWLWNFGDGSSSTAQNPSHSYSEGGEYTVVLKATNQYGPDVETKEDYITIIDPRPLPDFNTSDGITGIQPYTLVDFIDQSTNNPDVWQWAFEGAFPNTSTVQNPSNINYPTTGVYDVTLIVSNEYGTRTITKENFIEVSNNAVGLAVDCWPDNSIYNTGETVTFTASVTNGTPPYTYVFNFNGSPQTINTPAQIYSASHVFNTSGNMAISVTISDYEDKSNTCAGSVTIDPIGGVHNVDFTWSPSTPVLGQDITFQNLTTGGAEPYLQSYWEWFEDPNTGNPTWAPHSEIVWTPNATLNPPFVANYDELGDCP
ncbi:MAG: PKD domain-containing protein, partial [Bacteroidales bacterium]